MARINLLDTRTVSFGDLIGNGKIYQVPDFQRDYSWKEENWEDLWQDILVLLESKSSHYMGAIVLQDSATSDKNFTIIDGQQRLATLSIIAIAVIDKIKQLINRDIQTEDNKIRRDILTRNYLGDKDPRSLRYSSKLILNENNNDFYQGNLINLRKPLNVRSLAKTNQLLWQAFEYYSERLQELNEIVNSGDKLAEFLTDTIAQGLLFIQISVEDELNAYTVFETLNARVIELSSTDLLKNYLFSLFQGPDDLREAQRQWKRIINTVQMERFPEFLRYYLSLKQTRVRRGRLFKIVRNSVKNAAEAFALLDRLEDYSSLFVALSNHNDDFWRDIPNNKPYVRELQLFKVKQAYPTLLAAYKSFSADDFTRLLKLVCIFSFRYTIVSSLNPNELEKIYNQVAIEICRGNINSPRQVFDKLKSVYVSDEKFLQDFSYLSISTKGQKKKLAKYILCKLEEYASGKLVEEDSFSIEHILPESPSEIWRKDFSEIQIEEIVYKIGNLTLLEPYFNRQIGNDAYSEKQKLYEKSVYELTSNIQAEEWTPDNINLRQTRLARSAVHIWRADFAN